MITIISEEQDLMTDLTLEWLVSKGASVRRIQDHTIRTLNITIDNEKEDGEQKGRVENRYWIRRGKENYFPAAISRHYSDDRPLSRYLDKDDVVVSSFVEKRMKEGLGDHCVGSLIAEQRNNKLENLSRAKSAGLLVPPSCVTNCKAVLVDFLRRYEAVITKDLHAPVHLPVADGTLKSSGVISVELTDLAEIADRFASVFVQQKIPKQLEVRSFIFGRTIHSMAIFSQNDERTATDFRNYNAERPNRCVPFRLPEAIVEKLFRFMELAQLDTGSVDLILTPEGRYFFLEVNPMGQFHWLSENCNYYLEHFIAEQLANPN